MHRWQDEDSSDDAQKARRVSWVRIVVGQAIIVAVIGGTLAARTLLPNAEPRAETVTASTVRPTAMPATSISARPDSQVPDDLTVLGRRFLTALSRGDLVEARRDVASGSSATLSIRKLESAASAFQTARARGFRVLFWQTGEGVVEPAQLTVSFDYDRPDTGEGRSRVVLRVLVQNSRWFVADVDINPWMTDLGLSRTPS
ncbi:MAG: hypothetical protein U0556_11005 [Dehalococcoidia bacterium]